MTEDQFFNQEPATTSHVHGQDFLSHGPVNVTALLDQRVAQVRASFVGRTSLDPELPRPVYIDKKPCFTVQDVLTTYVPKKLDQRSTPVMDFARQAVEKSAPATPRTALERLHLVHPYLAWCVRMDVPLTPEVAFHPDRVEHYCATQLAGRTPRSVLSARGGLRTIGLANTRKAPWQEPAPRIRKYSRIPTPYTATEIRDLHDIAATQSTPHHRRVMTAMLTLGLGAGLRPWEAFEAQAADVITHPLYPHVLLIVLPQRVVPVRADFTHSLTQLCENHPVGTLIGEKPRQAATALTAGSIGLDIPQRVRPFTMSRLRTTWSIACLNDGLPLADYLRISGTTTTQNLHGFEPYLTAGVLTDPWVLAAAGASS